MRRAILDSRCCSDHRPHGGIGGYYGNGLGGWHAWDYSFTAEKDSDGKVVRLIPGPAQEPGAGNFTVPLDYAAPVEEFLKMWKPGGWNTFRIRCVGEVPHLTTWINGVKIRGTGYGEDEEAPEMGPQVGESRWWARTRATLRSKSGA